MRISTKHNLGSHLIFDGYDCDARKLADISFITNFLNTLVDKIGMKKLTPPR